MKKTLVIFILILTNNSHVFTQIHQTIENGSVVELEMVQTPENTLLTTVMERDTISFKDRVFLYRSMDLGNTWEQIDYGMNHSLNAVDPIITVDEAGKIYLLFMRIYTSPELRVELEMYRSEDDGQTWMETVSPQSGSGIADYPQIISTKTDEILVSYTLFSDLSDGESKIVFKKSNNAGLSWESEQIWEIPSQATVGADLINATQDSVFLTFGDSKNNTIFYSTTTDAGLTWSDLQTINNPAENDSFNITKPYFPPSSDFIGVISHQPHQKDTPINLHYSINNGLSFDSNIIDTGAYASCFMDDENVLHLIYQKQVDTAFQIHYTASTDGGISFSPTEIIYTGRFTRTMNGEYQSFFKGHDGRFYLSFCDWSDQSKAKILVYSNDQIRINEESKLSEAFKIVNHEQMIELIVENTTKIRSISIYNLNGQRIKNIHQESFNTTYKIPTNDLTDGIYLISIETKNKIQTLKFIR